MDVSGWFHADFDQFDFGISAVATAYSVRLSPPLPSSWLFWRIKEGRGRARFKVAGILSFVSSFLIPRRIKNSFSCQQLVFLCSLHFIALYKFRADYPI